MSSAVYLRTVITILLMAAHLLAANLSVDKLCCDFVADVPGASTQQTHTEGICQAFLLRVLCVIRPSLLLGKTLTAAKNQ